MSDDWKKAAPVVKFVNLLLVEMVRQTTLEKLRIMRGPDGVCSATYIDRAAAFEGKPGAKVVPIPAKVWPAMIRRIELMADLTFRKDEGGWIHLQVGSRDVFHVYVRRVDGGLELYLGSEEAEDEPEPG